MGTSLRIPKYRRHKATGKAVVTINGRDIYLGKHGSAESRQEYARLITEFTASFGVMPEKSNDMTVVELLAAYNQYAKIAYNKKERANLTLAMKPLRELYGRLPMAEFGPLKLKAVRQKMVEAELARRTVNKRVIQLRRIFKWGVENELVPASILHALQAVAGLRYGRTEAKETAPVKPVPDAFVDEVIAVVSPVVADMIKLQRVSGMRSGEMVIMRACDIDTTGKVWIYTPASHKTAHHGHERKVYLGPQAQAIIKPYLRGKTEAYLFTPQQAVLQLYQARHLARKTPLSCGNRPGTNCRSKPRKKPGVRYTPDSYRRAVTYGITKANKLRLKAAEAEGIPTAKVALIPHWHPHQLRHNAATNLRREFGIEVARIILGHRSPAITEVYAEVDHARAIDVMARVG